MRKIVMGIALACGTLVLSACEDEQNTPPVQPVPVDPNAPLPDVDNCGPGKPPLPKGVHCK